MRRWSTVCAVGLVLSASVAAGCGGSSGDNGDNGGSDAAAEQSGGGTGPITLLQNMAVDSFDPQVGYTNQSASVFFATHLGLYTYKRADPPEGNELAPALAEALPEISSDGKTYKMKLRDGVTFSDGTPVKATDVRFTIERALKLSWGGSYYFLNIKGADDFVAKKAEHISGITADDATREISFELTGPYGAFTNVLALPGAGVVPSSTPMKAVAGTESPPGVGPYIAEEIVPNRSAMLKRNPKWAEAGIDTVPAGQVDISIQVDSNVQSEAQRVLDNQADVFDTADTVPPTLLAQVTSKAKDRYEANPIMGTYYFFLNTRSKPFNDEKVRQAVMYAIDRPAMARLASGTVTPACFFLPPEMPGHDDQPCMYGDPTKPPNLEKAKQLVEESGLAGTPVTVWGMQRSPRRQWTEYFASVLQDLGFKAQPKIIADATYYSTVGNRKQNPQAGWYVWPSQFPNPVDMYTTMDGNAIQDSNNANPSLVDDPKVQSELKALGEVPAAEVASAGDRWKALDAYTNERAYIVPFAYMTKPRFFSERMDFDAARSSPYGTDFTSFKLK